MLPQAGCAPAISTTDERGLLSRIEKDMIPVSGFKRLPNEVESVSRQIQLPEGCSKPLRSRRLTRNLAKSSHCSW